MPDHIEIVVPDASGHVSDEVVSSLFNRLWKVTRDQRSATLEIDMTSVQSTDKSFAAELEFLRRALRPHGGEVRVKPIDSQEGL